MGEAWKKFIQISLWLTLIIFVIRMIIGGMSVFNFDNVETSVKSIYDLIGYAGEAIGLTSILMILFNKWAWKLRWVNYIIGKPPVLGKLYSGVLKSDYDQIDRNAKMEIQQTFLKVNVKISTDESRSSTVAAVIEEINNEPQLTYIYFNEPNGEIQDRSAIHYGTAMLKISNPKELVGNYYTGRNTKGSMKFILEH